MSNELYLQNLKNTYENLQAFSIKNNTLILSLDSTYTLPLVHLNLSNLNPNIFYLSPLEIYQILYMLELLYKTNLTNAEIDFITQYVKKYLLLNDTILDNSSDDTLRVNALSIPIYTSYDPIFINSEPSNLIQELVNQHSEDFENGKNKGQRLVLINSKYGSFDDENDNDWDNLKNAGFTALLMIGATIALTVLYITYFIFGH